VNRPAALASALAIVAVPVVVVTSLVVTDGVRQGEERSAREQAAADPSTLTMLVVRADAGPLMAILGSSGSAPPGAIVIPSNLLITIPGQGDGTAEDAALLPGRSAATAMANLLGVWIPHFAVTDTAHLAGVVNRVGGIEVLGRTRTGAEVGAILDAPGAGRLLQWRDIVGGLLGAGATWEPTDLVGSDGAATAGVLSSAAGGSVEALPTIRATAGLKQPDREAVAALVSSAFGAPDRSLVPVVVLNGSGVPGVGEAVAERLVPAGFQVVVNANAASFDHEQTLVVAGTERSIPAAEHVAQLLGVGQVSVSGIPTGLGDVTIIVGSDFRTG
jgi:hypothetical protein